MVRENLNPKVEIIGIVPTMYDKRLTHSREADEILRENFGDLVYNTRIRKTVRFAEAPVKGSSVLAYEPEGEAAAACTVTSRRRCSMARNRASMREGPLADLFRATEAAQRQSKNEQGGAAAAPDRAGHAGAGRRGACGEGTGSARADPDPGGCRRLRTRAQPPTSAALPSRAGSTRCPSSPRASNERATAPRTSR